jgi:nitrogen regulatory protein P-II 2
MKQFTLVVKPFRAEAVLKAIAELDVVACVAQEAKGYSRQKGYLDRYAGSEYSMAFLPKVEITVWVSDDRAKEVGERIVKTARTGRIGDGKVFELDMGWPDPIEF